jgi:hypothetical protein
MRKTLVNKTQIGNKNAVHTFRMWTAAGCAYLMPVNMPCQTIGWSLTNIRLEAAQVDGLILSGRRFRI